MRRCGYGLHTHGRPSLSFARSWREHIEAPRPAILPGILQMTREAFPRNSKHRRRAAYFVDKILKVRNRAIFRSSNPPNSGRSSISRPPRRSASIRTLFAVVRTSPELAPRVTSLRCQSSDAIGGKADTPRSQAPHRSDATDPMYGPAVRCKRISSSWRMCGLASMYPAFDWSLLCSGPSWISARVRSH
jgi:hypothetical protein